MSILDNNRKYVTSVFIKHIFYDHYLYCNMCSLSDGDMNIGISDLM